MANFLDLADELLSEILLFIIHDLEKRAKACQLCSMALLSRRMSNLVRPLLFRDITLHLHALWRRESLFLRSIAQNPFLGSMVRSFNFSWSEANADVELHDRANYLLSELQNLRTLSIQAVGDQLCEAPFEPWFFEFNKMELLSSVSLRDQNLTAIDMAEYMFLPAVESVTIYWIEYTGVPVLPQELLSQGCPTLNLDLDPGFYISQDVLKEVLRWPRSLRKLRCAVPPSPKQFLHGWKVDPGNISTPLSPSRVSEALVSAKESLEELELHLGYHRWLFHDGSRMDLSMMERLKRVRCPGECLFARYGWANGFNSGLYKLLPSSIETLHIDFGQWDQSRISSRMQREDVNIVEMSPSSELNWLLELAQNKKDYTPHLQLLHLADWLNVSWSSEYRNMLWEPPPAITKSFSAAGIKFVTWVGRVSGV